MNRASQPAHSDKDFYFPASFAKISQFYDFAEQLLGWPTKDDDDAHKGVTKIPGAEARLMKDFVRFSNCLLMRWSKSQLAPCSPRSIEKALGERKQVRADKFCTDARESGR